MLYDVYNDYSKTGFKYYEPLKFNYLESKPKLNINIPLGNITNIAIPLNMGIKITPYDLVIDSEPTTSTSAMIGSRAYNLSTMESWLCKEYEKVDNANNTWNFIWEKDEEMYINKCGSIFIPFPDSYYADKLVKINVYNFRYELLKTVELGKASKEIYFNINEELVNDCFRNRNSYPCEVILIEDEKEITAILPSDFSINIA